MIPSYSHGSSSSTGPAYRDDCGYRDGYRDACDACCESTEGESKGVAVLDTGDGLYNFVCNF